MPSIRDIPQLRELADIAAAHGVWLKLYGGTAFRLALQHAAVVGEASADEVDLFDICPFTSGIDLIHSGTPSQTGKILASILENIESAECFRWEIRSSPQAAELKRGEPYGNIVPARSFTFSTEPEHAVSDPTGGLDDIANRSYRYFRNPRYPESPLYLSGSDLEVFSALLYVQTLIEAKLPPHEISQQPGFGDCSKVFSLAANADTIARLQTFSYLRSRLRYLICNCIAATDPPGFSSIAELCGMREFLHGMSHALPGLLDHRLHAMASGNSEALGKTALSPSASLGGDALRLPLASQGWTSGELATAQDAIKHVKLGDGQRILLASPVLSLCPGVSASSAGPAHGNFEFIHFCLPSGVLRTPNGSALSRGGGPESEADEFSEEDMSGLLAINPGNGPDSWNAIALPCVVSYGKGAPDAGSGSHLTVRMNCYGLLEKFSRTTRACIQFFLVGWVGLEHGAAQ